MSTSMRMTRKLSWSAVCWLLAGCAHDSPTGPVTAPAFAISDAVHSDGKPHFYFLPPMVPAPSPGGIFDADLEPSVEICLWVGACNTTLVTYTTTTGPGSETIRMVPEDEHYVVNWHTDQFGLDAGQTYRIRILVGGVELGFADVDVVTSGKELRNVDTGQYVPLLDGRTLPVKFRIEEGFLGRIEVAPPEATIDIGETHQFSATLYDLHDQVLTGPTVTWSTGIIASVDQTGLATGVDVGSTTVTAASSGTSGSAVLMVEDPVRVFLFTTCGSTGRFGPSQAQCDAAYAATDLAGLVSVSGGIQSWTATRSATYRITAVGAQGAAGQPGRVGGRGALIEGDFVLSVGAVLSLAVGQAGGGQSSGSNGGGAGGSFVVDVAGAPLMVAGGGGGTRAAASQNGCDASTGQLGIRGLVSPTSPCAPKITGLSLGGVIFSSWGSAGAGFLGDGANDNPWGTGGRSWANGLVGGALATPCASGFNAQGGFGGGGAGNGCYGGGGGGGYSGGDGGFVAGGGGSFNSGSNPFSQGGAGLGPGWIRIERL